MSTRHTNERQGEFATETIANEFDLEVENDVEDWYDAIDPSTGTKYEVKSTHRTLESGASGRFRLWEDQHRSLVAAERANGQTAYYGFVVLEEDGEVQNVVRRRPTTVTSIVGGEWNRADHAERDGRQHKVPWYQVVHR